MNLRRVPRQIIGWKGRCLVEGESIAVGWRDCRVLDISMLGLGITLIHRQPSDLVGRGISVEVPATADSICIRLEGEIKNAIVSGGSGSTARVGVEFVGLTDVELAIATVLGALSHPDRDSTPSRALLEESRRELPATATTGSVSYSGLSWSFDRHYPA
jgi:hypothetical protein